MRHIGEVHRFDPGLVIHCGIEHCPQTYRNYESFRSHVYRKHRNTLHPMSSSTVSDETTDTTHELELQSEMEILTTNNTTHDVDIIDSGAKFLLKAREEYRIPQSTLEKLVSDMDGLWMLSLDSIKLKVKEAVESSFPTVDTSLLLKCFDDSFPLDHLTTEYSQLKYYKEHFNYLVRLLTNITIAAQYVRNWLIH